MGTKISFSYDNPQAKNKNIKKYALEEPFYCVESPVEILKAMAPKYPIARYNSIQNHTFPYATLPIVSTRPGIQYGNSIHLHGMNIEPYQNNNGLAITGSISNFDTDFPQDEFFNKKYGQELVEKLIRRYLIELKVLDWGLVVQGSTVFAMEVIPSKILSYGKQKGINYMDVRKDTKDQKKEQNLEDILDYGRTVLKQDFTEKNIRKISSKLVKDIPKEFDPQFGPDGFFG
jgi:hypothetical protein